MSIEDETNLIEWLTKNYPPYDTQEYHRVHTMNRDAYWRRRMKAAKDEEEKQAASRVY